MDVAVSLQDVANIITFVAPGYFAARAYGVIFSKAERNFPHLLIESIAYSLPIVSVVNALWGLLGRHASSLDFWYVLMLLVVGLIVGLLAAFLRRQEPLYSLAARFGLPSPNEDFLRECFQEVAPNESVTVVLKDGTVFSGRPAKISRYNATSARDYYFDSVAWLNPKTEEWEVRSGGLIIGMDQVAYIETF